MQVSRTTIQVVILTLIMGCGSQEKVNEEFSFDSKKSAENSSTASTMENASTRVDLDNKGIGRIKEVELADSIDQSLAEKGRSIYEVKCTVCHRVGEKFIGPAPNGILGRRSPEWVMNMILNPELMIKEDSLAKDLFMEFNGSPMANQGLNEDEARAILEYFRTL